MEANALDSNALLAVEGIKKSFRDRIAVDDLSFTVRRGEIFGFLGPNGAGKTTSLRMILGITRPDQGRILFEGGERVDRRRIGYLPEERGLYDDQRVIDTLAYLGTLRGLAPAAAKEAGAQWLERLGLADRGKSKLQELSKGMQQKVQLAAAVLHDPILAVLDEPFSGLDPLNQELFLEIVRDLRARGTTVLFSAHQLNLVERLCDRFLLIARGRRVLAGSLDEMRHAIKGEAQETLALEIAGRDGNPVPNEAACRGLFERSGLGSAVRFERLGGARVRLQADLPAEIDLGLLLAEIGRSAAVLHVETRPISLHEIYLHAVRARLGDAALEEEPSHV